MNMKVFDTKTLLFVTREILNKLNYGRDTEVVCPLCITS